MMMKSPQDPRPVADRSHDCENSDAVMWVEEGSVAESYSKGSQ